MFGFDVSKSDRVVVMGHLSPDGDSVSSASALAKHYDGMLFLPDKLNPTLQWIIDEAKVDYLSTPAAVETFAPTVIVVVDCAPTKDRTGFAVEHYLETHKAARVLNIDHHPDRAREPKFRCDERIKKVLWPDVSSTAEVIILEGLNYPFLYAGLATDTGNFEFSHPARAMRAALALGLLDHQIQRYRDLIKVTLDFQQLKGLFTSDLRYVNVVGNHVLFVRLTVMDGEVLWKMVDLTRGFDFVSVSQSNGRTSMRTRSDTVNLSDFAKRYGGGGHPKASGCIVNLEKWEDYVDDYCNFIIETAQKEHK